MTTSFRFVLCTAFLLAALTRETVEAQQPPPPPDLSSLEGLLKVEVESVSGAARHPQRTTEAPASVLVITSQDIETFGWRTLADVLRSVRGFHVTYDRNYSYVGVRAFGRPTDYNNRVLVLVDGHRFNDSIYDGALIGTEFALDLDLVDRIEVIRGPGSALYGTSAFLAVVNVITRPGTHLGGREDSVEAGTFDTYQVRATHGWAGDKGRDVVVSATRRDSRGPRALFFPEFAGFGGNDGWAYDLDGDESTNIFGSASAGGFRLQAVFSERERSSHEFATYVQDEVSFSSRLTGVFGGRYDWWSLKGGTGRPRLGLVYRTESETAIKVLYGEAYRAPNLYELCYGGGRRRWP